MIRLARKRSRTWVAVVLPGLLLRALIPVGFMPMFGPGMEMQLALCEDYAPVAPPAVRQTMDMSMDMSMDMPMDAPTQQHSSDESSTGDARHSPQDHNACPYAASSTLATQSTFAYLPTPVERPPAQPSLWLAQVLDSAIAPRAQSARGPPFKI